MELTDIEIQILKQLLSTASHTYTRGFQCECGHISEEHMTVFQAADHNNHGMVCKNCGEVSCWKDIKIKHISFNLKKIKKFDLIEQIE